VTGSAGVPKTEFCDSVGVDMLWCSLELSKDCKIVPCIRCLRVIYLKQRSFIALNN
jgi:hypothetical protein